MLCAAHFIRSSKTPLRQVWILPLLVTAAIAVSALAQTDSTHKKRPAKKPHHTAEKQAAHTETTRRSGTRAAATHAPGTHASGTARSRRSTVARTLLLRRVHRHRKPLTARQQARSRKLQQAFVASSQLRPMAQQLATLRTPAAFDGVTAYAHAHTGEAASAAYLALGHAYLLDRKFPQAVDELRMAGQSGDALADYAAYLTAQAYLQSSQLPQAEQVLGSFVQKYPDSIFVPSIPVLQANLFIQQGDPQNALRTLAPHRSEAIAGHADFLLAEARANSMAGNTNLADQGFRRVYLDFPLSNEAAQARTQLVSTGAINQLPPADRRRHADALYHAGRYEEAETEYRSLASSGAPNSNELLVAAAACAWKQKRLKHEELDRLPDTSDEAGARRQYLYMELARDKNDNDRQAAIVQQMETRFPTSPWLAEALFSSGNMYLLEKDYPHAIAYYEYLSNHFPKSCESPHTGPCSNYSPSVHWRAAWLTYRLGDYINAARMFDEQLARYAGGQEIPAALYWRARVYQLDQHDPAQAANYYHTLTRVYRHYYYADLAEQRLAQMGQPVSLTSTGSAQLDALQPEDIPELSDDVPDQDPHLVKARLLANAGLNEYISAEIQAADGSEEWGSLAEAQIYAAYGETAHAMRLMKRAVPYYTSAPIASIPLAYWRILFPQPYWSVIKQSAADNGVDPYMVASLIRQESEFNPNALSNKDAYGLMQLLPSVGKQMAKQEGVHHFDTRELLDPATNIRLGTRYLKQTLDKFGDKPEYAFAAYNAGDNRVIDWESAGNYRDMDEFVESIPFSETRGYVQALVRNQQIYRELDKAGAPPTRTLAQR